MEMQTPRERRTELLAAARQIAAVLVERGELAEPERKGILRVLLEGAQRGLRGRRDFPRELRAEAVGEEVAFRLARLGAGEQQIARRPVGAHALDRY